MMTEDFNFPLDFTDALLARLTNQPFAFPNPREIGNPEEFFSFFFLFFSFFLFLKSVDEGRFVFAAQAGNADFIQPGLLQLQPSLDDLMDTLEPLQGMPSHVLCDFYKIRDFFSHVVFFYWRFLCELIGIWRIGESVFVVRIRRECRRGRRWRHECRHRARRHERRHLSFLGRLLAGMLRILPRLNHLDHLDHLDQALMETNNNEKKKRREKTFLINFFRFFSGKSFQMEHFRVFFFSSSSVFLLNKTEVQIELFQKLKFDL